MEGRQNLRAPSYCATELKNTPECTTTTLTRKGRINRKDEMPSAAGEPAPETHWPWAVWAATPTLSA